MAFLHNCKKAYQSSENNLHSMVEKDCTVGDSVLNCKKVNLLKTRSPILPQQRACNMAQYVLGGAGPSCMIHEVQGRCWPVRSTCEGQGSAGNRRVCRWPSAIRMKSSSYHHSVPMLFTTGWGGGGECWGGPFGMGERLRVSAQWDLQGGSHCRVTAR